MDGAPMENTKEPTNEEVDREARAEFERWRKSMPDDVRDHVPSTFEALSIDEQAQFCHAAKAKLQGYPVSPQVQEVIDAVEAKLDAAKLDAGYYVLGAEIGEAVRTSSSGDEVERKLRALAEERSTRYALQKQAAPKANDSEPVWEIVMRDMRARHEHGVREYGVALQAFNGRNPLQDAYEENLDRGVYLRQAMIEWDAMENRIDLLVATSHAEQLDAMRQLDAMADEVKRLEQENYSLKASIEGETVLKKRIETLTAEVARLEHVNAGMLDEAESFRSTHAEREKRITALEVKVLDLEDTCRRLNDAD